MDESFVAWREKLAPLIYDWFSHHNLPWPTQACRFGSAVEDLTYKTRYRVYYSEQTDDSEPQKLIVATADVCKPNVASAEVVSSWTDFSKSPYLNEQKVIFHPGEVNKIREVPQHPGLVVTHTDAPELLLWNVEKQPHRPREKKKQLQESIPDMKLVGHEDEALFPLATTPTAPLVASGGNDSLVMVWDLADSTTSLLSGSCGGSGGAKESPELQARSRFEGHTRPVEEVVFKPGSTQELASVGDDAQLMFWDARTGSAPVLCMKEAHGQKDIQCVDWSPLAEHCIATGAQDGSIKVWDTRAMRGPDHTICSLRSHTDAIIRLEWHPQAKGILASGGDDRIMMLWNINVDVPPADRPLPPEPSKKKNKTGVPAATDVQRPKELMMQHSGHRRGKVVDFQWCPTVPWAIMSVSDDSADEESGGGSLQLWRPSSLLYEPQEQVLERLNQHRSWILEGRNPPERQPLRIERAGEEIAEARARAEREAREARDAAQGKDEGKGKERSGNRAPSKRERREDEDEKQRSSSKSAKPVAPAKPEKKQQQQQEKQEKEQEKEQEQEQEKEEESGGEDEEGKKPDKDGEKKKADDGEGMDVDEK